MVQWLEWLGYGAESVKCEFETGLCHAETGKLSLSTQQYMGTFFELGKDKAAKGEGWAPPFISCAPDTVGLYLTLPLRLLGYGKPLPLKDWNFTQSFTGLMMDNIPCLQSLTFSFLQFKIFLLSITVVTYIFHLWFVFKL